MRYVLMVAVVFALLIPQPAAAWGFEAHRFISERAIDLLPPELAPFFRRYRDQFVEHTIDPDLWRNAGFEAEPPRHFMDLDAYGKPSATNPPRDYEAAVAKFGREMVDKNGLVPWRTQEIYDRLLKAFQRQADPNASFAANDIWFFSAVISHYIGDAHVPLHSVLNYDGQLTNQHGIHSRFESELFTRYRPELVIRPAAPKPITQARDFVFDALLASFAEVEPLLTADRRAVAGKTVYDDDYFAKLFRDTQPILEKRLNESITAVAGAIIGAWERAGRPAVPAERKSTPRKVRSAGL
jgi:hypothetical protein